MHTNKLANPGPLGLMGFGMTTVLLNLHNAGFFPLNSAIISMGIFFGGPPRSRRSAGIQEGQHLRHDRFHRLRQLLAEPVGLLLLPRLGR